MSPIIIAAGAVILFLLVFSIFRAPVKLLFKLIFNTVIGLVVLFLINYVGGGIGISVPVNWINAAIVGVFGVPGVAVVLLLQWIMGY